MVLVVTHSGVNPIITRISLARFPSIINYDQECRFYFSGFSVLVIRNRFLGLLFEILKLSQIVWKVQKQSMDILANFQSYFKICIKIKCVLILFQLDIISEVTDD